MVSLVLALTSAVSSARADVLDEDLPVDGGVSIMPAMGQFDLEGRTHTVDLRVRNGSDKVRDIEVEAVELGHSLDGTPTYGGAVTTVTLVDGEPSFTLAPGESRQVTYEVDFSGQVAEYFALIARPTSPDSNGGVSVRTQVASLWFLRGPRPWQQEIEQQAVGVERVDGDQFSVWVDAANVGNAHVAPTGTITATKDGTELTVVELTDETILPGFARRLSGMWTPSDGPTGEVELTVELEGEPSTITTVNLDDLPVDRPDGEVGGVPGAAILDRPAQVQDDGMRRVLLPLAALLVLVAMVALWLLHQARRDDEVAPATGSDHQDLESPDENDDAPAEAGASKD